VAIIEAATPPRVLLSRAQWVRLIVVGILAAFSVGRVAPDAIRLVEPLGLFGYATNGDGVVLVARNAVPKGSDRVRLGDRVRIDHIKPFDRKPGLVGFGYTRENFDRKLPIERNGHLRVVHLIAEPESVVNRAGVLLRVLIYLISVLLGGILFLVKPGIMTFGFFIFCLGGDYPTSFTDVLLDNPWRQIPQWIGDTLRGAARAGLLLFTLSLIVDPRAKLYRLLAVVTGIGGLALGTVHAYAFWLMTYAGRPALAYDRVYAAGSNACALVTAIVLALAIVRARESRIGEQRTAYIVAAFLVAGIAHVASDALFPRYLPFWFNSLLVTTTIIPIVVVWIAVIRHHYFDVDWVVSRAVVYVALTGAFLGTISVAEEIGTYVFYNNTDLAYGFLIAISMGVGAFTGRIKTWLDHLLDRFVFRDRMQQRIALELIAGYLIDAESVEDVYRALLEDATHALKLSFAGILRRREDDSFILDKGYRWPEDCVIRLAPDDELTAAIARSRAAIPLTGKETRLIRKAFPNERLTFAAPLFVERSVDAIIVYGHNVEGLDLDPDEREHLTRVVTHASIALTTIELARYRREAREKSESDAVVTRP
jgi:hypothetical protein